MLAMMRKMGARENATAQASYFKAEEASKYYDSVRGREDEDVAWQVGDED